MAVGGFATVYRSLLASFKFLLTSQDFGSEYEILCAELSLQSLRVRLWGESVGLDLENTYSTDNIHHSLLDRQDATPTITQVLNNISFLLIEIKQIRLKYRPRNPIPPVDASQYGDSKEEPHSSNPSGVLSGVNSVSFRHRIRANQKQKSIVAITKWAWRDARKFEQKVKRLKGLVDGLEDISRLAGIVSLPQVQPSTPEAQDHPPPYSVTGAQTTRSSPGSGTVLTATPRIAVPTSRFSDSSNADILKQHTIMKRYLAALPSCRNHPVPRAREKLVNLSNQQFKELRVDVFDELLRRQQYETPALAWLQAIPSFHPKRNEARKKLSTLIPSRFGHLVSDIVCELERRWGFLQDGVPSPSPFVDLPDPFVTHQSLETRRWGCVRPNVSMVSPPPFLQYRAAHKSTLGTDDGNVSAREQDTYLCQHQDGSTQELRPRRYTVPKPLPKWGNSSTSTIGGQVEIFKSFRVSMEDPTYKVLPAALKKYNINAPWEQYALYVVYGDFERCLGMEEKPLVIFKLLDKAGKKPMFMLRKISTKFEQDDFGTPPGGVV